MVRIGSKIRTTILKQVCAKHYLLLVLRKQHKQAAHELLKDLLPKYSLHLLLSLDLSLALLFVLLVDEFLFERRTLMSLRLQPSLLLHDQLLLPLLKVLLAIDLFLLGELFAKGVRLRILTLLNETLKHFLVLK